MKHLLLGAVSIGLCATAATARQPDAVAQTEVQRRAAAAVNAGLPQKERVRRWLAYNTPGKAHRQLGAFVGDWDTVWSVWEKPGDKPYVTRGTASFKWAHDGRFVRGDFQGVTVGRRYDAQLLLGFDSFREHYVATWVNSLETAPLIYRGRPKLGAAGRLVAIDLKGKADDCVHGRFDLDYRAVFAIEAEGRIRESVYGPGLDGREVKTAEIVYTKRGQPDGRSTLNE